VNPKRHFIYDQSFRYQNNVIYLKRLEQKDLSSVLHLLASTSLPAMPEQQKPSDSIVSARTPNQIHTDAILTQTIRKEMKYHAVYDNYMLSPNVQKSKPFQDILLQ
jgi:hypothetical protein